MEVVGILVPTSGLSSQPGKLRELKYTLLKVAMLVSSVTQKGAGIMEVL